MILRKTRAKPVPRLAVKVSAWDLAIFLWHLGRAAKHPRIGWQHMTETIGEMKERLNRRFIDLHVNDVEELLWCANMCDEEGEFWHPEGKSFGSWAEYVLQRRFRFNPLLNQVEPIVKAEDEQKEKKD